MIAAINFQGDDVIVGICVLCVIIGAAVIVVTKLVADYARRTKRDEMETTLKMEMIGRGISVEEIERVLLAWSEDPELAKSMSKARKMLGEPKPAPNFA